MIVGWSPKKDDSGLLRSKEKKKLDDYTKWKWSEVTNHNKSRGKGKRHHYVSISSIIKKTRSELEKMNLIDDDMIFSLAIYTKSRLFGFVNRLDKTFYIVWYDPKHEICPRIKK